MSPLEHQDDPHQRFAYQNDSDNDSSNDSSVRRSRPLSYPNRLSFLLLALALLLSCCRASPDTAGKIIAPGVSFTQEITDGANPNVINILRIDLKANGIKVQNGQAQDFIRIDGPVQGRETISDLAARKGAIAAINADFFPYTGDPLGLAIRNRELISEASGYRAAAAFTGNRVRIGVPLTHGVIQPSNGSPQEIGGINRVPHNADIILLTPTFRATPAVDASGVVITLRDAQLPIKTGQNLTAIVETIAPIEKGEHLVQTPETHLQVVALGTMSKTFGDNFKSGDSARVRFDLYTHSAVPATGKYSTLVSDLLPGIVDPRPDSEWTSLEIEIEQAIGGGPLLIRDGKILIDGEAEGFPRASFIDKRHPRTALGVDADGKLLLVTVDGRAAFSQGASLLELANIMLRLGAVQALNLDGGGSTTMVVNNLVVNAPSDGAERPVANGLLVFSRPSHNEQNHRQGSPLHIALKSASALPTSTVSVPSLTDGTLTVDVGTHVRLDILDETSIPIPNTRIVWGTPGGFGFVSQSGDFVATHPGEGRISAQVGDLKVEIKVHAVGTATK